MLKSESLQLGPLQFPSPQTTASGFRRSASGTPNLWAGIVLGSESRTAEAGSRLLRRAGIAGLCFCLLAACLAWPSAASAQSFTLLAAPFSPDAVSPGGTSASNITVGAVNGFSGTVDLTCAVTPTNLTDPPACLVSPATVTAPGSASATITTMGDTSAVPYSITITGTAPSTGQNTTTPAQNVTVLAVAPQFTVTIQRAVQPGSVPAGNGAVGIISINPINGYISPGVGVTLACNTITPLVTYPPYCSFSPNPVKVNGTVTSSLTINTYGPVITRVVAPPSIFYALWIPFPMLALVGLGAAVGGKRARKAWGLLALFVVAGTLFLMPACGNTTPTTTTHNGLTPDNTYTFTVIGVDADGVVSSNTGSGTNTNPSVTLTVTTPTH